ncbi:MAG: hypothetical protein ACI4PY_01100 [Akkermansia muciniphila]|nr:hypothetical protein [Akkermansia muciniphila]
MARWSVEEIVFYFVTGGCYRTIPCDIKAQFVLNERWDFETNNGYNIFENALRERIPEMIANMDAINPRPFTIIGSFSDNIHLEINQDRDPQ